MSSDANSKNAGSLPVTSLAILEALAIRNHSNLSTTARCSPAASHFFERSTDAQSLPEPSSMECWHCGYAHQVGGAALGACVCGVAVCEPCWLRLTEQAEIMVDLGEVSQELINGASEILELDQDGKGKKPESQTVGTHDDGAEEALEVRNPSIKTAKGKGTQTREIGQDVIPRRQTRNFARRFTRSAAKEE